MVCIIVVNDQQLLIGLTSNLNILGPASCVSSVLFDILHIGFKVVK